MDKSTLHILLVDDERISREVESLLLSSGGHSVVSAKLPSEALKIFSEQRERIDVVVLDMLMPEMTGKELFSRLKEISPGVRAVLLSGYGKSSDMQEALANGLYACMQKPVSRKELLDTVMEAAAADM
jgi:two-component system cell cycle sensor histidine kinase/response regulator CckA